MGLRALETIETYPCFLLHEGVAPCGAHCMCLLLLWSTTWLLSVAIEVKCIALLECWLSLVARMVLTLVILEYFIFSGSYALPT